MIKHTGICHKIHASVRVTTQTQVQNSPIQAQANHWHQLLQAHILHQSGISTTPIKPLAQVPNEFDVIYDWQLSPLPQSFESQNQSHNGQSQNAQNQGRQPQHNIDLNQYLQKNIRIEWAEQIFCVSCGKKTKKSYAQGHCYLCFKRSAGCDLCMMKPETCHFHLNTCRDEDWAHRVCFQPHIVYLAYSSHVKVGITRLSQVPTRWLDQGASMALPIVVTSSRRMAGMVESHFKNFVSDKTDWRAMLKNGVPKNRQPKQADLFADTFSETPSDKALPEDDNPLLIARKSLFAHKKELQATLNQPHLQNDGITFLDDFQPIYINYPMMNPPKKIKSLNLDKTPNISGQLLGIKGQYLIMDTGVINIRKYNGYHLTVSL